MARRYTVQDVNGSLTTWLRVTDDEHRRLLVLEWIDQLAETGLDGVSTFAWHRPGGQRGHHLYAGDVPGTDGAVVFSILDVPIRTVLLVDVLDLTQ